MADELKKLVDMQLSDKPAKLIDRKPKTLSFDVENYKLLQDYCRQHGLVISDVVNDLIALYLRQVAASQKEKEAG